MKSEKTILDLVFLLQKEYNITKEKFIKKNGISQSEYNMFICIHNNHNINSYAIADKMNLSLSRVSRIIDKMVKNDFLIRHVNNEDRRAFDLETTEKGEAIIKEIASFIHARNKECESHLNEKDIIEIKSGLNKLINIL